MTFHNKNEMEVQRSKVNFDVHAVDTFAHRLRMRANTGESNSSVLGCSLAQSQARAPVEANYARRRRLLTHFYMYAHKHYVIIASQFTHCVHLLTVILSCSHDIVLYDKYMDKVFTQTLHSMYIHSLPACIPPVLARTRNPCAKVSTACTSKLTFDL